MSSRPDPRQVNPEVMQPYLDAGAIEQADLDIFLKGGLQTSRYSMVASIIGVMVPVAYQWRKGIKIGIGRSLVQGVIGSVTGGIVGTAVGAWRMKVAFDQLDRTPEQVVQRLSLYQALSRHQTSPTLYPLPRIPNPSDPSSYNFPTTPIAPGSGLPLPTTTQEASRANPWAGKAFPQPPRSLDGVPLDGGGDDDAQRDSQGRLFPGVQSRQNDNGDRREDADAGEMRREREREVVLGGGRMGMDDRADLGTVDQATRSNPTSWALLRSRAPPPSTVASPSANPISDYSSSSLPPPSISSSSSSYSSSSQTDRQKEQAEFDRLLESERGTPHGSGGTSSWGDLRAGGPVGGGGGANGKEEVW